MTLIDYLIHNFSCYYESLANIAEEYSFDKKTYELIAKLRDGRVIAYEEDNNTIRELPRDRDNLTEEEWRKEFGRRLKRIMWMKSVSQTELSERSGIGQTLISRYISGKANPSFYNVSKIARVLNCSIDEII